MLPAADSLLHRFWITMASSDSADAQADVAELLREAAEYVEITGPSDAEFREGVDHAATELRRFADEIANHSPAA